MSRPSPTLIYRITHINNVPWILEHGLHSGSSNVLDSNFVTIGNRDLISRRMTQTVPIDPGGTLDDYIPFYFCTHSVMLYQIHTGRVVGVDVPQSEVVYLVSSVERLVETGSAFVFTDRHALVVKARYFSDPDRLDELDWRALNSRDFRRDPVDPERAERRMAEMLVHRNLPGPGLLGIACQDMEACMRLKGEAERLGLPLYVKPRPDWYFS